MKLINFTSKEGHTSLAPRYDYFLIENIIELRLF